VSTPQEKFLSALTLAFHESTIDADIVAGIRGASRLLRGMTIAEFLNLSASQQQLSAKVAELQQALATSEAKVEGAIEYCNELKLEIERLKEELVKPPPPPPVRKRALSNSYIACIAWLSYSAVIIVGFIIMISLAPAPPPVAKVRSLKSVLVARGAITPGQILKLQDLAWQRWPDGGIRKSYILAGTRTAESFAGLVARDRFEPGEPITDAKITASMTAPQSR
jgi:flagella basal body P-ring formation protein FlgA